MADRLRSYLRADAGAAAQDELPRGESMGLTAAPGLAFDAVAAAREVAQAAAARAAAHDHDGGFPSDDIADLARLGLLAAPAPRENGGAGLGEEPGAVDLCDVLRLIGYGSLALGRLYEGHVNALQLIARHGRMSQRAEMFSAARQGHLFGVWNTEPSQGGLRLHEEGEAFRLEGRKTFASGAGFVTRALVTARTEAGGAPLMAVLALEPGARADLSAWRAHGMRASATGTVDLTGITIGRDAILGGPDDYHRQPHFSGGAWRFAAVQAGGVEAILDAWRQHLRATDRGGDPHQLARLGDGAIAATTARLWVEQAARMAAADDAGSDSIVAFVNLARLAVEAAGLDALQNAQRSIGLAGFLRDHPFERLSRDLATYLRQPAPDRALAMAARHVLAAEATMGDLWRGREAAR